jgi:hypothetical protein
MLAGRKATRLVWRRNYRVRMVDAAAVQMKSYLQ